MAPQVPTNLKVILVVTAPFKLFCDYGGVIGTKEPQETKTY